MFVCPRQKDVEMDGFAECQVSVDFELVGIPHFLPFLPSESDRRLISVVWKMGRGYEIGAISNEREEWMRFGGIVEELTVRFFACSKEWRVTAKFVCVENIDLLFIGDSNSLRVR